MRERVIVVSLLFCHSSILEDGYLLAITMIIGLFFFFWPYSGEKSKNFSVSCSMYGHAQHFVPGKLM